MVLALADHLGAEGSLRTGPQLGVVILENVQLLLDLLDPTDSNVARPFETIGDFQRVDAPLQKFLSLLKDGAGKDDNTSSTITNLIVLGGREFCEKFGGLMVDLCDSNDVRQQY